MSMCDAKLMSALGVLLALFYTSHLHAVELSQQDCEKIQQVLNRSGWKLELSEQGNVLLTPPGQVVKKSPEIKSEEGPQAAFNGRGKNFLHLKKILEPNGWRVNQGADGSMLLYPAAPPEPGSADPKEAVGFFSPLHQLREKLEKLGWKVERSPEGDLLLYPQLPSEPQARDSGGVEIHTPVVEIPAKLDKTVTTLHDIDADGVSDALDWCEHTAPGLQVNSLGCDRNRALILEGVNFNSASAELTPSAISILEKQADKLKTLPDSTFMILGHTDSSGPEALNLALSRQRAKTVQDYFIRQGVDAGKLGFEGFGETRPIASNRTATGRKKNRRVELRLDAVKKK